MSPDPDPSWSVEELLADLVASREQQDVVGEVAALTRALDVPGLDAHVLHQLVARRAELYAALRNPVGARRDLRWMLDSPGADALAARAEVLRGLAVVDDHLLHRPRRAAASYREAAEAFAAGDLPDEARESTVSAEAAAARAADPEQAREWMRRRRAGLAVDVLQQEALRLGQVRRVVDLGGGRHPDLPAVLLREAFPGAEHVAVDLLPPPDGPGEDGVRTSRPTWRSRAACRRSGRTSFTARGSCTC